MVSTNLFNGMKANILHGGGGKRESRAVLCLSWTWWQELYDLRKEILTDFMMGEKVSGGTASMWMSWICVSLCVWGLAAKTQSYYCESIIPFPPPSRDVLFSCEFPWVTGDLEGHFTDVCLSASFGGEIRGKNSGSDVPKRGCSA